MLNGELIQRDLIRSLGRSREGSWEEFADAMVNGIGWDWLRNSVTPERMELWTKSFEIKEGLSGSWTGWHGSPWFLGYFLKDAWMIVLQQPAFPKGWDGILDGKELQAQLKIRLARHRVAGLFFGCSRGDRL